MKWRFEDAPNTMCFTTIDVLKKKSKIIRVLRDIEANWQFHDSRSCNSLVADDEVKIVALSEMLELDPTLEELWKLPIGWAATRNKIGDDWVAAKDRPFPTYAENGFYVENAEWFSENFGEVSLPSASELEGIVEGDFVKLAFRFASENAEQLDGQYERMWVRVHDVDQDWMNGIVDNEPFLESHQYVVKSGDSVEFHLSQVIEIFEED